MSLFTFSHSSLPGAVVQCFILFLISALTEVQPMLLIYSGLAGGGSLLDIAGTGTYLTWSSFWTLLREATSAAP